MKKALLLWFVALLVVIPGCQVTRPHSGLTDEQIYKLELIPEIKDFEKRLGFNQTENFETYSAEIETRDYWFYTPKTVLPYSLDDPRLHYLTGDPESIPVALDEYDVFFYPVEALAGVKTPITSSLLQAPLPRFIHLVFHEDWQEQMALPLGIEEPSAEIVSYVAAMLFAVEKFDPDTEVYYTLRQELHRKLKESRVYQHYYEQLDALYSEFYSGGISKAETLRRKARLLEAMGNDLEGIWRGRPEQLNNAFIAFQMTYLRHLPLLYEVFLQADRDIIATMAVLRSMPRQGAGFADLEELKDIEDQVTDYLRQFGR